jgi:hypothetical protein
VLVMDLVTLKMATRILCSCQDTCQDYYVRVARPAEMTSTCGEDLRALGLWNVRGWCLRVEECGSKCSIGVNALESLHTTSNLDQNQKYIT